MPPNSKRAKKADARSVKRTKPTSMTQYAQPLLKKPLEHIGKQVYVKGSYWEGCLTSAEKETKYLCTLVMDFTDALHTWGRGGRPPCPAFKVQEMGESGTGNLEHGDASGEIFFIPYPHPFLEFFYDTFPELLPMQARRWTARGYRSW
ncbi:hypothetical protein AB1Y20_021567 [Prymnesium parvum]|uniref:Uncharacterized protein n=1 Tax=Prymnesium parvum TaxID=97485 RepID=A0AB34JLX8_PRYPA